MNGGKLRVYNFEIADHHTYAVGELEAWVHNARANKKRGKNSQERLDFEFALSEVERACGMKKATKKQRRQLHDEITKQGFTVDEIIEIGIDLFGGGKNK